MGFSSYDCKHCGHPILHHYSVDPEINEWMKEGVVLTSNGSRLIGEYDGYGCLGGGSVGDGTIPMDGAVWAHQGCWEVAGKPEFEDYDGPSRPSRDQGYFFDDDHDMIDPRITDEAERERLLKEGVEARDGRRYTQRARQVAEWLDPEENGGHLDEEEQKEPWKQRFSLHPTYEAGEKVPGRWWLSDKFPSRYGGLPEFDDDGEPLCFAGTKEEAVAHLAALWAQFVESDEAKAYIEHRREEVARYRRERLEKMKVEGRYEVSYRPAPKGDTVKKEGERDWTASRSIYTVHDKLTYDTVATMDGPDKALGVKTFVKNPDYDGNGSPEWEARVEDLRAATKESRRLAEEECQRLNDQWARDGYPVPEKEL